MIKNKNKLNLVKKHKNSLKYKKPKILKKMKPILSEIKLKSKVHKMMIEKLKCQAQYQKFTKKTLKTK